MRMKGSRGSWVRGLRLAACIVVLLALLPASSSWGQITNPGGGGGGTGMGGAAGPKPAGAIRIAAFGDYGQAGSGLQSVSDMVHGWELDAIITLGDNVYDDEITLQTLDRNIGQYYHDFIGGYIGDYGAGSAVNRFFPSLGNHDWPFEDEEESIGAYKQYFNLPGDGYVSSSGHERYYDFVLGNIHFFALNSNFQEPHGSTADSTQAEWLQEALARSTAEFQIAYFHHPPYNSGNGHGDQEHMQWPFKEWGVDAVLAGHEHIYERLMIDGLPYFTNGVGGSSIYNFTEQREGSQAIWAENFGSILITALPGRLQFDFYTIDFGGVLIDRFVLLSVPEPGVGMAMMGLGAALVGRGLRGRRSHF